MAVGILGTGSYLPADVVTNADLAARMPDADIEWIDRATTVRERRFAGPDEAASDLAAYAGLVALRQGDLTAGDIDYLIVVTSTGDSPQPATATLVQQAIGASRAVCFDLNAGGAGFVLGLAVARGLVVIHPSAKVLLIGADVYSRILDPADRHTRVLFGDGAGAAVVGTVAVGYGILDLEIVSRSDDGGLIRVDGGGSRHPASEKTLANGDHYLRMDVRGANDVLATGVPPVLDTLLRRTAVDPIGVDHFVPHQSDGELLRGLVAATGLGNARTHLSLDRYGDMGAASVPVTLDEAARSGALRDGDLVLLSGFGAGLSIGGCLLRWGRPGGTSGAG
jgi:3-oxoacyl-(acyl-carrier-protein) synthase III